MQSLDESLRKAADGFRGEIAGLGLSDVIQLNAHNRFSGCITVQHEENTGFIFFRDGGIVHAEQGEKTGEEAFYDILGWPAGQFTLQPKMATTRATIQKGWQHLVLEAHRLIDERRAGRTESAPPSRQDARPKPLSASTIVERVRRIPGVAYAIVQGKDGARLGDDSYEAEALAGQAVFLAMVGKQLGSIFRIGEVHSASVQGKSRQLLLFAAKNHYLSVLVDGESQVGSVEVEIRRALAGGQ